MKINNQKRVAAIHDISCAGRCSLTVVLPILSCAGIETNIIPTAVLSTQTGGFTDYTYKDLTDEIMPISKHWKSLNRTFDAIYTGYLGSFRQIDIVKEFFNMFGDDECIRFVDPVMGDHGVLYENFDLAYVKGMKELCKLANIITPNITEAMFMLGDTYIAGPYTKEYIESIIKRVSKICPKVIITGLEFQDSLYGAACYDVNNDIVEYALTKKVSGKYHGTGDVFASSFLASLLNGISAYKSLDLAVKFTVESIKRTKVSNTDVRFGVDFEQGLFDFIKDLRSLTNTLES